MLIISKQKDYYDGVVGTVGIDKTIVYERQEVEFKEREDFPEIFHTPKKYSLRYENSFTNLNGFKMNSKKYDGYVVFIVGFCGKLYIGWKLYYKKEYKNYYQPEETIIDITYDINIAKKHINFEGWKRNLMDDINYVLNYDPINIFRTLNAPYWIYDSDIDPDSNWGTATRFYVNPVLKNYKFYRVLDTFTTFQEIQMFISGVLGTGEKEIINVDDKYKIPQHGFNKWSFRREPSKHK